MTRKVKKFDNPRDAIKRYLTRAHNQELAGQTKLKHYREITPPANCYCCKLPCENLDRHRVIPGPIGEYDADFYEGGNVYWCCKKCHRLIHRIYDERKASNNYEYRLALLQAEIEMEK
jgi:hypothetical protein